MAGGLYDSCVWGDPIIVDRGGVGFERSDFELGFQFLKCMERSGSSGARISVGARILCDFVVDKI